MGGNSLHIAVRRERKVPPHRARRHRQLPLRTQNQPNFPPKKTSKHAKVAPVPTLPPARLPARAQNP